ncbi:MAG: DUF6011 domain-containing protein [Lysinibacillus sp.]
MKLCARCNRKLRSQKSIDVGFGPTCKKKFMEEAADAEFKKNQMTIFDIELESERDLYAASY